MIATLATERLSLSPLQSSDAAELHGIFGDAEAMVWWDSPAFATLQDTAEMVDRQCRQMAAGTHCYWSARLGAQGAIIGAFDLSDIVPPIAEIGFILGPRHWRRGLAREAIMAVMAWGNAKLGITRFLARYQAGNDASAALLAALGFGPASAASPIDRAGDERACLIAERRV